MYKTGGQRYFWDKCFNHQISLLFVISALPEKEVGWAGAESEGRKVDKEVLMFNFPWRKTFTWDSDVMLTLEFQFVFQNEKSYISSFDSKQH